METSFHDVGTPIVTKWCRYRCRKSDGDGVYQIIVEMDDKKNSKYPSIYYFTRAKVIDFFRIETRRTKDAYIIMGLTIPASL